MHYCSYLNGVSFFGTSFLAKIPPLTRVTPSLYSVDSLPRMTIFLEHFVMALQPPDIASMKICTIQ
jgi:hypothetical protein